MHQGQPIITPDRYPLDPAFGPARRLPDLTPGTPLEIVKLDPDGEHVVTYPGVVLRNPGQSDWLVTEAAWTNRTVDLGGLVFHNGDRLIETFSGQFPFNCFAVLDPESGRLRGWYANVAHPVRAETEHDVVRLIWHDLYLDIIGNPEGYLSLRDEDELAASGLADRNPPLHAAIVASARHVMGRMADRFYPFVP